MGDSQRWELVIGYLAATLCAAILANVVLNELPLGWRLILSGIVFVGFISGVSLIAIGHDLLPLKLIPRAILRQQLRHLQNQASEIEAEFDEDSAIRIQRPGALDYGPHYPPKQRRMLMVLDEKMSAIRDCLRSPSIRQRLHLPW